MKSDPVIPDRFFACSVFVLVFLFDPAEVGTHLVGQTGQAVEQTGIISEHLVIFEVGINDIVVDLAPTFLKQGSALNLHILSLVLDDVVEGAVDAAGDDVDLVAVIDFAVTGALISLGLLGDIVVGRILVEIPETIHHIVGGIVFELFCDIAVEVDPVLPIQEKHADTDQIGHIFVEVGMIKIGKLLGVFLALANDLLQQMGGRLGAIAIGMDAGGFDLIEILINEILADIVEESLHLCVNLCDGHEFLAGDICGLQILFINVVFA